MFPPISEQIIIMHNHVRFISAVVGVGKTHEGKGILRDLKVELVWRFDSRDLESLSRDLTRDIFKVLIMATLKKEQREYPHISPIKVELFLVYQLESKTCQEVGEMSQEEHFLMRAALFGERVKSWGLGFSDDLCQDA